MFVYVFCFHTVNLHPLFESSQLYVVYFCKRFSKLVCKVLIFTYCPAFFEMSPPLISSKQKAGITPGPRIKIHFSTTFWPNRIRILAAWARVVVPAGSKVPPS